MLRERIPRPMHGIARSTYYRIGQATSSARMLPGFILIGGQRCGTTTLFKHLAEHPQILRPGIEKGLDYFTLHYDRDMNWYRGNFPMRSGAKVRTQRWGAPVAFEACTYYMFHPFAMERIAADLPGVRIIAMLRDPVERAFSAYKHEHARGFDTASSFEEAIDLEDERLDGELERMAADMTYESHAHRHHAYVRRSQYAEQLRRVYEHFPREQVHVLDSETFFDDPYGEYRKITEFLGIAPWMPEEFLQHNARPSLPLGEGFRARLDAHFVRHDEDLAELLGSVPGWRR
ncbi:sulfotransferase family protein [Microbacterium lacticum]|uniref:sulfotransferase family protein n=1 Tax=Microbacterium lacticum TaxID=33885 RepID=UPI001F55EA5D|nr:sulfotransferase [Microbacterium lacticum]